MARLFLCLLVGLACAGCNSPECATAGKERILASDLNGRYTVIGRLGVPLGTAVLIEGEIVSGADLNDKVHQSDYLLRVRKVGDQPLADPITMDFVCPPYAPANGEMPRDTFERYESVHHKKASRLYEDDIKALNEGYVGETFRILAYESGRFGGMPRDLPPDMPLWQDFGWHFHTCLEVLVVK